MKKILICLSLISCFFMSSCSEKSKLAFNSMTVQIEPAGNFSMSRGSSKTLSAIIRNAKTEIIDEPVKWSVSNGLIGSFSDTNASTAVFTAGTTVGSAVITLTCYDIQSAVTVSVN